MTFFKKIFFIFLLTGTSVYGQESDVGQLLVNGKTVSLEQLLQEYIQIPSVSGNEKAAGDFIRSVCEENGLHITPFGEENGMYNFAASVYPLSDKKPNIVLLNHIDVVPESEENEFGQFSGKISNGNIYGRGAIDNKGAAVMQLGGIIGFLKNINTAKSDYNITFLAVSCEETQCTGGVNYVIENFLDLLNPVLVIGEGPTELSTLIGGEFNNPFFAVSVAHKRTLWLHLELELNGMGHASITPLSYANKDMIEALDRLISKKPKAIYNDVNVNFLKALGSHKKGIESFVLKHPRFFKFLLMPKLRKQPEIFSLFSNTLTITNINSHNKAYNIIPEKAEAYLDCRLLPEQDENEYLKDLEKTLKNDSIKITITGNMPKAKPSSTENIFYHNLEKAIQLNYPGSETIPVMMPNVSDLGAFRSKGITSFASIPVYLTMKHVESIHNRNEMLPVKALYDGAQVFCDFISLMME
jgi:acetylornithine deacetylase/succinyl-diaminopimelate desuccinylase-like protein